LQTQRQIQRHDSYLEQQMTVIRIFLGVLFATGVAGISSVFMGTPLFKTRKKRQKGEILEGRGEPYDVDIKKMTFNERLASWLYQAKAPITPAEFLGASFILGLLVAAVIFFTTRALFLSFIGLIGGAVIYYLYLLDRKEKASAEYELVQPAVAQILLFAFETFGETLDLTLAQVADHGPEIVREDWKKIQAAFSGQKPSIEIIREAVNYRSSPGFSRLVELILQFHTDVGRVAQLLVDITKEIQRDVTIARLNKASMSGAKRELAIVAALPVFVVLFVSLAMPGFGDFYGTFLGQIVVIVSWGMTGFIYFFATNSAKKAINPREFAFTIPEDRELDAFALDDDHVNLEDEEEK